ncbi:putative ribonuclease H-like domain-containing protein [Tanacetum coccineum]
MVLRLARDEWREFQQPEFEGYGPKTSKSVSEDISNEVRESPDAPLVEELVLDDKLEKKTVFPTNAKMEFADCNHHQRERVVSGNTYTRVNYNYSTKKAHLSAYRNMVPRAVLMKTGIKPLTTARPVTTAHPKSTVYSARPMLHFSKSAQSTIKRPKAVNTARPNSVVVNAVRTNQVNAVKALACWVWKLTKFNSASITLKRHNFVDGHLQKKDQGYIDSGCSRHMTGNMSYLSDFKEFDGGYVTFRGGAKGGKITSKGTLKTGKLDFEDVYFVKELQFNLFTVSQVLFKVHRQSNMYSVDMKNIVPKESLTCLVVNATLDESILWHRRLARTPQQNGVTERRNRTLIEDTRTMLADSKLPTTFWVEAVNIACYVQNRVLVVKPHNKTLYELFRGKFDGKSDEGFFIGYSMNSKAFRVYIIRTRKAKENLHIRFLEDKPIIVGDGPKWLFDIDVLTKLMNYVPVVAGTNSNDLVDGSLFDSSSKNASNDEPQPSSDAGKKDDEGVDKEHRIDDQERPKNSSQDVNTAGPSINTASTNVNTGSLNINTVSLTVTTAPLEATHADFFGDETEVDISNITTTYPVPSTPNTRIHKDHSLDHVIGDVQSSV